MERAGVRFAILAEIVSGSEPLFLHNLSLEKLYENVVVPYEEDKPFFIDGVPLQRNGLRRIKLIRQTSGFEQAFEFLHDRVRFPNRDSGRLVPIADYPGRLLALDREFGDDVTSDVINAYREKRKLKIPIEAIIEAASNVVAAALKGTTSAGGAG